MRKWKVQNKKVLERDRASMLCGGGWGREVAGGGIDGVPGDSWETAIIIFAKHEMGTA